MCELQLGKRSFRWHLRLLPNYQPRQHPVDGPVLRQEQRPPQISEGSFFSPGWAISSKLLQLPVQLISQQQLKFEVDYCNDHPGSPALTYLKNGALDTAPKILLAE